MATVRKYKFSFELDQGFFFYDRNDFNEAFNQYTQKLKSMIEGTWHRWTENFRAGKDAPE